MIWFTADTHFGHGNIIKHSGRPFADADEMDDTIIANLNDRVAPADTLYHLGDWSWSDPLKYRDRITCENIILILGNHDKEIRRRPGFFMHRCFREIHHFLEVNLPAPSQNSITLCHYALKVWNKSHWGTWHLYGHSHGSLPDDPNSRSFDIGVDCHDFKPLNLDQVRQIMERKHFVPIDHHGRSSR